MASIISLIGPPGSGKGTYGALLASRLSNASFISVGDVLREQSINNEQLSTIMKSGALVDDGIVNQAVIHSLNNRSNKNVIILDGILVTNHKQNFFKHGLMNCKSRLLYKYMYQARYVLKRFLVEESVQSVINHLM